jgi:hypothetical protein
LQIKVTRPARNVGHHYRLTISDRDDPSFGRLYARGFGVPGAVG